MLELTIEPGVGIGPIRLGAQRDRVREQLAILGFSPSAERGDSDYFCDNALLVEYTSGTVSFIGVSEHERLHCTYHDVDVFDLPAERVFALLAAGERHVPSGADPDEFVFPDQIVSLWEPDEQYDRKGGFSRRIYGQVGLGDSRYLAGR